MKIEIDTKQESNEDLRKLIRMLQSLVGESSSSTSSDFETGEETATAFGAMFDSEPIQKEEAPDDSGNDIETY